MRRIFLRNLAAALAFWGLSAAAQAQPIPPAPAAVATTEQTIPSQGGVALAATLRVPTGVGPHPVLVVQPGAGPAQRGAWPGLHARLNRSGIATLEFDKRGVGRSTGTFTDSLDETEADLKAVIAWLRSHGGIDPARVALLGHSQGAAVAPALADEDGRLAAIVLLAGPVGQRGTMILEAMHAELTGGGVEHEAAGRVVAAARTWLDARSSRKEAAAIAAAKIGFSSALESAGFPAIAAVNLANGLDSEQFLSMYEQETALHLKALKIPVLAIFAGREEHGDRRFGAVAAVEVLADNPRALVVEVPGAGHNFTYRPADAPKRVNPPGGRDLFPERVIAEWLASVLVPDSLP